MGHHPSSAIADPIAQERSEAMIENGSGQPCHCVKEEERWGLASNKETQLARISSLEYT